MWNAAEKVADASKDVERHIFETNVKPRITAAVVEEHRAAPFGRHSSDLEVVLRFLRRDLLKSLPRYVVVSPASYGRFEIGRNPRVPGVPISLTGEVYETEEEAEHAVFLLRLRALGDPDVDRILDRG
jgi:hypothetical protein